LFGIGNQMLAAMALILGTVVLFKMKKERYAWVTLLPTAWLFVTSMTAGWQKIFSDNPKVGFLALARKFESAAAEGTVLAPAKSIEEMSRVAFNNQVDAVLCGFFMLVAIVMLFTAFGVIRKALSVNGSTAVEIPPVYREVAHG